MNLYKVNRLVEAVEEMSCPGSCTRSAVIFIKSGDVVCSYNARPDVPAEDIINKLAMEIGNSVSCPGYEEGSFLTNRSFDLDEIKRADAEDIVVCDAELVRMNKFMKVGATKASRAALAGEDYAMLVTYDPEYGESTCREFKSEADVDAWWEEMDLEDWVDQVLDD